METHPSYTIVGLFVIVLTGAIIFSIIWLSSGIFMGKRFKVYQINMKESVSGVSLDSYVEYNGVKVGKVARIAIDQLNHRNVVLLIKVFRKTPISVATRAKYDARALSGIAFIALEDKGTDNTPLVAKPGQKYPIIPTIPSIFVRLDTILTQLNDNFDKLSKSFQALLSKENLNSFRKVLHSSQSSLRTLEIQTLPAVNQTMTNMEAITNDLSEVSDEMKENPSILIRGTDEQTPLGPGEI